MSKHKPVKKSEKRSLQTACWDELHKLEYDNFSYGRYWFLRDGGEIVIAEQEVGQPVIARVSVSKRAFDFFIDRYQKEQRIAEGKPDEQSRRT